MKQVKETDKVESDEQKDYDYIVTPYQERIADILELPYPIFWFVVSSVLLGLHLFILGEYNELHKKNIWPHICIGFLPFLIATGTIWFSKTLEDFTPSIFKFIAWPKEKILSWYENEIRLIFNDKRMAISGLFFSVCLPLTGFWKPLWHADTIAYVSLLLMVFVLSFLAGGMIYTMIRILIMVCKMSKIDDIKVSVYQHPVTSVKAVGKLMLRLSLIIIVVYLFGISYFLGSKPSPLMISITLFFGLFVMFFFIYPQLNVHKIMYKVKHKKLMSFSSYIEESLQAVTEDPSVDNVQRVRELFEVQQSLNGMGEWPFNTKLFITLLTGIAIPILVVLVQWFLLK